MGRPTLPGRTRAFLVRCVEALEPRGPRFVALGSVSVVALFAHLLLEDPRIAWLAAPLALVAGLAGGVRSALSVAYLAAAGHLAVDLVIGIGAREILGVAIRTAVLPGLALVGTAGQQTERQRDRAMHRSVNEDPVTGLLNVRAFYDALAELLAAKRPFTILLVDIRGMRSLNERYGHPSGTEAVRALAHVLRRSTGPQAVASRLGSDEVAVTLVGEDRHRCQEIIESVRSRLHDEQVTLPDGERFEIHAAYGIARYPQDGDDAIAILRAADSAKERAKTAGLDRAASASEVSG